MHASGAKPLARISASEGRAFREHFLERGVPVVIGPSDPPLPQFSWDLDVLRQRVGDQIVPVYDWGDVGPTVLDEFEITRMPLADFIDYAKTVERTDTPRLAVSQLPIDMYLPGLDAEYRPPDWIAESLARDRLPAIFRERPRIALFITFFRGMHWHNGREVIAQLTGGRKQFVLFSPDQWRSMYPRRLWKSGLRWFDEHELVFCSEIPFERGFEHIDLDEFPLFRHAQPYEVVLQPGETLYIPPHWWHMTQALEPCVVIAHFWDAPLRRWSYPLGFRSAVFKPYRKYLYGKVLTAKRRVTRLLHPRVSARA
jgi:hypothetical protein